ncbi:chromosome segregation protein SMC [Hydrocarboniphaga sp.]|uniref:chromosome segregation protein SMC n=1 Tax=Hydrocarboniphaga sp. TaxID=2033016 RepID=UPI003D0A2B8C
MRLSGIKLAGFKSFVDPTQLPLPANLTGVVGPNGCGKSNIIDAVRWVLGEASQKQLRTQESEDVIFNGSKSRKPVGRAMVELTFDNSDGQITGPFAAYTEIAVRRELLRDGNSQYYLNGRKCLKRDVTDLFLGTGLGGKNQYAIIEQGMVSRMVEAKPEELRTWLEEAAGISKYKERRRETESRIRQTRENLARLSDLRSELQGRLDVLRKQAANAEKYREFKQLERNLKAEILVLRERALVEQSRGFEAKIAELAADLEARRVAVTEADGARALAETAQRDAQTRLSHEQTQVYEAEARLARQEQSLSHAKELKSLKLKELDQLTQQLQDLERRRNAETARMESLAREVQQLEQQAEQTEANALEMQRQLAQAEAEQQEQQAIWEDFQTRSEEPLFQTEGERVRLQGLERALLQVEERLKRLNGERATLDATPIQESVEEADIDLERLGAEQAEYQTRLQTVDRELQTLREQRSGLEASLHETRQQLQSARGRLSSLETLQQAALRQDDAELNGWLKQRGFDQAPRLATVLNVESGWESAVEHVLEGWLQAPLLGRMQQQTENSASLPKTGAALLYEHAGAAGSDARQLAAKVQGPSALLELLHGIYGIEDSELTPDRLNALAPGQSVVTRSGIWAGQGWSRYPRRDSDRGGVIAREQLLKQLRLQVEEHTRLLTTREQELLELRGKQQQLETERRELAPRFEHTRSRHAQRLAFRQAQQVRLEQTLSRIDTLVKEIDTLTQQRDQNAAELNASRAKLGELEAIAQRLREERVQLQQTVAKAREAVGRLRNAVAQATQSRNTVQVHLAGRRSAISALNQTLHDLAEAQEMLVHQRGGREREAEELDAPLGEQTDELEAARAGVVQTRDALRAAREALAALEAATGTASQNLRLAEQAKEAAQEALQQARLDFENLRARREGIEQQIIEACTEGNLERDVLIAGIDEKAELSAWEEKLASTIRRIERLGAINLAAIQELEEAETREQYLSEQNADLTGALDTLEEAIRKIDIETKDRFKNTFDQVDTIFRDRFPKLFGGGEAYLELTGDDLLDAGVRVMARPPGKRNSSIQMLSGGEKAMTAVALLLALFQLNPAPFCLMDEVDAPLDDANVVRFCDIVREMSQNVQFIIITHNKITMELASHLHGVTMQEPGVSRLVSVDVSQAVEMVGSDIKAPSAPEIQAFQT